MKVHPREVLVYKHVVIFTIEEFILLGKITYKYRELDHKQHCFYCGNVTHIKSLRTRDHVVPKFLGKSKVLCQLLVSM